MQHTYILPLSDLQAKLENVGGKGASLSQLANAGLPVPDGFHVTTAAYRHFVEQNELQAGIEAALARANLSQPQSLEAASQEITALFTAAPIPDEIAEAVTRAYADLADSRSPKSSAQPLAVAVRSSATAEDLPEASFAGQQETYLNIHNPEAVLEATRKCWASLWTARAIGYRARQNIDSDGVALAVVVQALIPAEAAGILFMANPINGQRDEMMISASWGLGEAVVGGLVTPDSLTLEKPAGNVIHRETASKLVQTARIYGGTEEIPVPENQQDLPVLSDQQATELGRLGLEIEKLYEMPMDIEWARSEGEFAILQARPITTLTEAPAEMEPVEWAPPTPKGTYMRASVVDLMPEPLSPLFVSWGIPTLREQMKPLGKRLTRLEPVLADDYFTSINNYAYMNHAIPPKSLRWILFGLLPSYPGMLKRLVPLWRDELHPEFQTTIDNLKTVNPKMMSVSELWETSQQVLEATMYYVCALMFATMGASAGSEMLLTKAYDKFSQEGDPLATTLLMGWDNIPVRAEKSLYDLATWCRARPDLNAYLQDTPASTLAAQLKGEQAPTEVSAEDWAAFRSRFVTHLDQFGHIIFQLDFAEPLPLDHPEPMLENIKMYLRGEGINPHTRQQASEEKRIQTTEMMLQRLKGLKLWAFKIALNWGQSMAEVREDALADIGLGYPLLRAMLIELGRHFVEAGAIEQARDIFWLEKDEIASYVSDLASEKTLAGGTPPVAARKDYDKRLRQEIAPPMMPLKEKVMGIKADVFVPHAADGQSDDALKGVAASAGKVTAPARILRGPEDFGQMRPGDILVAGTTTPAWTPLFVMASAVVTDVGGPLSHGSIVAREYGIPAVMGTGIATKRIQNGEMITVDGTLGIITFSENGS